MAKIAAVNLSYGDISDEFEEEERLEKKKAALAAQAKATVKTPAESRQKKSAPAAKSPKEKSEKVT